MTTIHPDHQAPILAAVNLGAGGVSSLIAKAVPHLSTVAVLIQIAVGLMSLWQMWRTMRKNQADEKSVPSPSVTPKPDRVQPDSKEG